MTERRTLRLPTSNEIVIGAAHVETVREAMTIDADLIVMGTHGCSALEKMFVGTAAEKAVRSPTIPVLTIREQIAPIPPSSSTKALRRHRVVETH